MGAGKEGLMHTTKNNDSREQLQAEVEELRRRLEETEEVLRAIQSGEVDALVVSMPEGEQVFTLKGAEHSYRVLVETMNEGAASLDPDGTIVYCNSRLATMLQLPLEKLIGSPLISYVAPADHSLFAAQLLFEDCDTAEISLVNDAGNHIPVLFSCNAAEISGNRTLSVVLTDISAQKQAEQHILRLNRLYAVLSGTNQAIVHAADRDSLLGEICRVAVEYGGFRMAWIGLVNEETGNIQAVAWSGANEGYLDKVRIAVGDIPEGMGSTGTAIREQGLSIVGDIMNDPRSALYCKEEAKRGFRSSAAISLKLIRPADRSLTLYSDKKDFFNSEFADLLLQMGMDISFALDNLEHEARRSAAEQALQDETLTRLKITEALHEKERLLIMQSRQAAVGEMVNNIAHQWRQPLNNLGLTVQQLLLYYDLGDFNREFLSATVDKAMDLVQHMSRTIDDFRNFCRPDKEMKPFNLKEKIHETLVLGSDSLKAQNIEIELDVDEDLIMTGYPNEFCQVLLNIINNARDALQEGNVTSPHIKVKAFSEGMKTVTTIEDNAGGIPDSIIDKVFDLYFTTKDPEKGTGIGLYMSKAIVEERMNGKLSVRNTGHGAEFRIEV